MVVGVVGSGKSSLIAALLGELHSQGGSLQVNAKQFCYTQMGRGVSYTLKGRKGGEGASWGCGGVGGSWAVRNGWPGWRQAVMTLLWNMCTVILQYLLYSYAQPHRYSNMSSIQHLGVLISHCKAIRNYFDSHLLNQNLLTVYMTIWPTADCG